MKKRPVKTEARSAREAMEKMLHEKKISTKINYDVLMNLNLGSAGKLVEPPPPTMETPTKVEETIAVKRSSKADPDIYAVQVYLCFIFGLFENCPCLPTTSVPGICKCGVSPKDTYFHVHPPHPLSLETRIFFLRVAQVSPGSVSQLSNEYCVCVYLFMCFIWFWLVKH